MILLYSRSANMFNLSGTRAWGLGKFSPPFWRRDFQFAGNSLAWTRTLRHPCNMAGVTACMGHISPATHNVWWVRKFISTPEKKVHLLIYWSGNYVPWNIIYNICDNAFNCNYAFNACIKLNLQNHTFLANFQRNFMIAIAFALF